MRFHSRPSSPARGQLRVEALEDRSVPAVFLETDAVGDFLTTYTGAQNPGLDVVSYEAVIVGDNLVFAGEMNGPIADVADDGGLYIIGVDRGRGTARFGNSPQIGPNVLWDSVVRINPDGTGLFNNIIGGGVQTQLGSDRITIDGNIFTASVPLSVMMQDATRPPEEWTYNLWPRNSAVIGSTVAVSDLAPDDGNVAVRVVAPAQIASVAINDGSAQRSMINSLTVTFDGEVTIDDGAFQLARSDGSLVELSVETSVVDGQTVALLTFSGADIVAGSLADGSYSLTIFGESIHDRWGRALDGDGDGAEGGDRVESFHRLFGDADGDGNVDQDDLAVLLGSFGKTSGEAGFLWYFDSDGDGNVSGLDMAQFNRQRR